MRPVNSIMMGLAVIVGEAIAVRGLPSVAILLSGFATGCTLTAASMAVNDYYDRRVDAVNAPDRPLPSGAVSPLEALVLTTILTAAGLAASVLTNPYCFALAAFAFALSFAYNTRGKEAGFLGNLMVSACVSLPFIYGGLAARTAQASRATISSFIFSAIAFLANTGREVTKGITDVEGDRLRKAKTIALVHGPRKASLFSVLLYGLAVALSALPWLLSSVSWLYIPPILLSDGGFALSSLSLLKDHSRENAMKVKRRVLVWMMIGLTAFVAGGVFHG